MNTIRTHRPLAMLTLAAGLALAAAPASADPWWTGGRDTRWSSAHEAIDGKVIDVQVRVNGRGTPLFFKPGTNDRHYFQAFQGRNYSLVLRNTTGQRIGVLIAVDGLNVVNGQRSTLDRHESMYVLDPWESTEIQGWRSSLNDVRRFVFVDEQHSYAERTGQANGDMGWIRIAAYREVERQTWFAPQRRVRTDDRDQMGQNEQGAPSIPAPTTQNAPETDSRSGMKSMQPKGQMSAEGFRGDEAPQAAPGTGWGDRRYDPVQQTTFEAQRWASDQITLRYEYASGLRALGIFPRQPRVFEREHGELGFAQPPRW